MIRATLFLAIASALACSSPPAEDEAFDGVAHSVVERSGLRVEWGRDDAAAARIAEAVDALLAQELTQDSAVQVALLASPRLQAEYESLGVARADLVQAGLLANPVFSIEVRSPGKAAEIHVLQDFLDVLERPLRQRVAEAELEQAKLRVAHAALELAAQVRAAWVEVVASEQQVEMRRSVAEAAAAGAEAARRIHAAGNSSDLELDEETAQEGGARLELLEAEAERAAHREHLTALMGVGSGPATWTIAARLPDLPAADPERAGLESLAVERRLDLAAARGAIDAAQRSLHLTTTTRWLPGLELGIHEETEIEGDDSVGPSLDVTLPLFDRREGTLARGEAQLRAAKQEYAALALEIRSEVRAARDRLASRRARAEYLRATLLPLRARIVEHTQLQYNGMQVGVFALLEARRHEIDAGRAWIESLRDYWLARAALERAIGAKLESAPANANTAGVQP